ncbi:MAG: acetate uptake transporter [Candidatus Thorarchaeota archaeon]
MSDELANPAPLGLIGFGMTTVLLNLRTAGLIASSTSLGMIFAMGIFYGGFAQIIAGLMEFRKGNTFGTVAFTSYGLFWMTFVFLHVFASLDPAWAAAVDKGSMSAYLFCWGVFTFLMFFGTLKTNRMLQIVFFTLFVLFFMLSAADLLTYVGLTDAGSALAAAAGIEGVFCGGSAFYLAMAEVNGWPIFPVEE